MFLLYQSRLRRLLLLSLLFAPLALQPQSQPLTKQLTLADMVKAAGVVVHGRIVQVTEQPHPGYANIRTLRVRLEVIENILGAPGKELVFTQYVGAHRTSWAGNPQGNITQRRTASSEYAIGRELILFLYPSSKAGFTSPVGAGQGKFRVQRAPDGRRTAVNALGNHGLFRGLSEVAQQKGLQLSTTERNVIQRRGGAVEIGSFLRLTKAIAAKH